MAIPFPTITVSHKGSVSKSGMVGLGADGRRVYEYLGSGEGVSPGDLRKPLVPARGEAEVRVADPKRLKRSSGRAGLEVPILEVPGRDWDVQLRVRAASDPSGAITTAVLNPSDRPGRASQSEACTYVPVSTARLAGEGRRRASLQLLRLDPGPRTVRGDGEVRLESQLLEADELCASPAAHPDALCESRLVLLGIGVPAMLDRPDRESRCGRRRADAGVRDARRRRDQLHGVPARAGTCWVMQWGPPPP